MTANAPASSLAAAALALAGCSTLALDAPAPSPFQVARDGEPRCTIAIPNDAPQEHQALAGELQRWLREVTGAAVPVCTIAGEGSPSGIVLGTGEQFPRQARRLRVAELGPEGFVVRSEEGRLWLLANTHLGLRHAVYAFLEEAGCRWFFPDPVWTVVPGRPDLEVAVALRQRPGFDFRRIWYGWGARTEKLKADYNAWMRHNRQLGHFVTDCGHAYERYVPRRLFDQHPEWFALVDGKRQAKQLCVTNPEVQRRVVEGARAAFRKDPDRDMVSVEPNDGGGYCQCPRCKALGSPSDQAFYLANVAAKGVRQEFPDRWVGLYAYAHHSQPPRFDLEPGVYVQVTTGFRYLDLTFEEQVAAFRERGAKLGVYDYFSVYVWDYDLPGKAKAGRVHELADSIRRYRGLGLTTYDAESACNWGPNGLGYWMAARLMWDPDLDSHELVNDFCARAFGPAAPPMRRLYERWATGQRFSRRGLKLALLDLQEARRRAEEAAVRARLDRLAMYLHLLRLWTDYDRGLRVHQGEREGILRRARAVIVYARRLMDTGLVHAWPMLFSSRFKHRFRALERLEGFSLEDAEPWKKERTDIPDAQEVARDFEGDLEALGDVEAIEIEGRSYSPRLVPLARRVPGAVEAWGRVARSPLCVETGLHCFVGRRGETVKATWTPFGPRHQVKGHWELHRLGEKEVLAEGDLEAEKGHKTSVAIALPCDGVFALDPGTGYWRAAELELDGRPMAVWAGRGSQRSALRLWRPRADQPLYFYVPAGTRHFVLGFPSIGQRFTAVRLRTAEGRTVLEDERVVAGDEVAVRVPEGTDGSVWSLSLESLRGVVELYDVPPCLARHPGELLVPEDALPPSR
ncbi:MAG: DUF4838 domain-containing protein [Candidatus Brocadiia bacterium]